jgi:hypothetical protein
MNNLIIPQSSRARPPTTSSPVKRFATFPAVAAADGCPILQKANGPAFTSAAAPRCAPPALRSGTCARPGLDRFTLSFSVARHEEFVRLALSDDVEGRTMDLGGRAHHYLLLTLARHRLADAEAGIPDTSCGWVYADDLARDLFLDATAVNLQVFRARRLLEARGIRDGAAVVERRSSTREIRIGSRRLAVETL